MKLQVKNFQAIKDSSIEGTGLIVITGPSNRGKSSMLRAMEMAVFGGTGDSFVRKGEPATLVGLKDENLILKWRKVATAKVSPTLMTALEVNGSAHTKLGREHGELTLPYGFREIRTKDGKVRLRPQFAAQHDSMFLISESELTVAEVMRELGRADVITAAQKAVKSDKKQTEARRLVREEDVRKVTSEEAALSWVEGKRASWVQLSSEYQEVERKGERLRTVQEKLLRWKGLEAKPWPAEIGIPDVRQQTSLLEKVVRLRQIVPVSVPNSPEVRMKDGSTLEGLVAKVGGLGKVLVETQKVVEALKVVRVEESNLVKELEALKLELGVCPLCGQVLGEGEHKD